MIVSGQGQRGRGVDITKSESGARARTKRTMLDAAMRLMQEGLIPSVTDVAEEAQVSRATAYRYYPTQAALIQAAVDEALGPILAWESESTDAEQRMSELLSGSTASVSVGGLLQCIVRESHSNRSPGSM